MFSKLRWAQKLHADIVKIHGLLGHPTNLYFQQTANKY